MGVHDRVKLVGGLGPIDFLSLIYGQTLLFKGGTGENLTAAEVTFEKGIYEEASCQVKVRKIIKQGLGSKIVVGDKIIATFEELTTV